MDIARIEVFGSDITVRFTDGSRERIENGIYELRNAEGDRLDRHEATAEDIARLGDMASDWESAVKPLDAVVIKVEDIPDHIDIYYNDGRKEQIDFGIYEIKDADNLTVFERPATQADIDRLFSLDPGEFGTGEAADLGPIEITGGAGEDDLDGSALADDISGLDGDDRLRGRGGDDTVDGGSGDDRVRGDGGDDIVHGGEGNDRVRGDSGDDTVHGDGGDDRVRGGRGNDTVLGGDGNDRVDGQEGDDVLNGGAGSDVYNGGLGNDVFVFEADGVRDVIKDFEDGADLIDISAFGVADFAALSMTQVSFDRVLIDLGGGDIIAVSDVTLAQLTAEDFIL
ncbi:calcium-binding protein [Seohaeicola zhoushanensis]|uniref:Calcium-binding protein n=1 Tax=Seohaeicola zhoushanensis TaxID=1569283 RepID=A0A8J3MC30_9RHOB|nr:calcium-binding protein [Seohaeicola zhoushanensis]GHF70601.1 hypothetical protein GCM10017056_46950 [Seohaeicola zhoushanensis]